MLAVLHSRGTQLLLPPRRGGRGPSAGGAGGCGDKPSRLLKPMPNSEHKREIQKEVLMLTTDIYILIECLQHIHWNREIKPLFYLGVWSSHSSFPWKCHGRPETGWVPTTFCKTNTEQWERQDSCGQRGRRRGSLPKSWFSDRVKLL